MVIVQKANKQLKVADDRLQYYLDNGYVEVSEKPAEKPEKHEKPKK